MNNNFTNNCLPPPPRDFQSFQARNLGTSQIADPTKSDKPKPWIPPPPPLGEFPPPPPPLAQSSSVAPPPPSSTLQETQQFPPPPTPATQLPTLQELPSAPLLPPQSSPEFQPPLKPSAGFQTPQYPPDSQSSQSSPEFQSPLAPSTGLKNNHLPPPPRDFQSFQARNLGTSQIADPTKSDKPKPWIPPPSPLGEFPPPPPPLAQSSSVAPPPPSSTLQETQQFPPPPTPATQLPTLQELPSAPPLPPQPSPEFQPPLGPSAGFKNNHLPPPPRDFQSFQARNLETSQIADPTKSAKSKQWIPPPPPPSKTTTPPERQLNQQQSTEFQSPQDSSQFSPVATPAPLSPTLPLPKDVPQHTIQAQPNLPQNLSPVTCNISHASPPPEVFPPPPTPLVQPSPVAPVAPSLPPQSSPAFQPPLEQLNGIQDPQQVPVFQSPPKPVFQPPNSQLTDPTPTKPNAPPPPISAYQPAHKGVSQRNMDEPSQQIIDTLLFKLQELRDIAVQSDAAKELINKIQDFLLKECAEGSTSISEDERGSDKKSPNNQEKIIPPPNVPPPPPPVDFLRTDLKPVIKSATKSNDQPTKPEKSSEEKLQEDLVKAMEKRREKIQPIKSPKEPNSPPSPNNVPNETVHCEDITPTTSSKETNKTPPNSPPLQNGVSNGNVLHILRDKIPYCPSEETSIHDLKFEEIANDLD